MVPGAAHIGSACPVRHHGRVPHITLKSIANNALIDDIWEKWQTVLEPLLGIDAHALITGEYVEFSEDAREAAEAVRRGHVPLAFLVPATRPDELIAVAAEDAALDRRAHGHDLVGVHAAVRLLAEELLDDLLHLRDPRGPADEDHLVDLRLLGRCGGAGGRGKRHGRRDGRRRRRGAR